MPGPEPAIAVRLPELIKNTRLGLRDEAPPRAQRGRARHGTALVPGAVLVAAVAAEAAGTFCMPKSRSKDNKDFLFATNRTI